MDPLQLRLSQIIFGFWHVPAREGRVFLHALLRSLCSRAATLRAHLTLMDATYRTCGRERAIGPHLVVASTIFFAVPDFEPEIQAETDQK